MSPPFYPIPYICPIKPTCQVNLHTSPKESYILSLHFPSCPLVTNPDLWSWQFCQMVLGITCKRPFGRIAKTIGQGRWPRSTTENGEIKCNFLLGKSVDSTLIVLIVNYMAYLHKGEMSITIIFVCKDSTQIMWSLDENEEKLNVQNSPIWSERRAGL